TGPQHAAVELHGFLAYIALCAMTGREYTVFGYKGKQVRDQIHCDDLAALFLAFHDAPRSGEVYNVGGGRANSLSILETVSILEGMGHRLRYRFDERNRTGDHICYISDLGKLGRHFPDWRLRHGVVATIEQILRGQRDAERRPPAFSLPP